MTIAQSWVLDGHNDLPWALREAYGLTLEGVDLQAGVPDLHTDLPRLDGIVGGQFWSVFVPTSFRGDRAVTATLEQVDMVHRLVARHSDVLVLATTADEVESVATSGRAVAGIDHVGLGSDYDGASLFPVGMPDVGGHACLLEVLRDRGWSASELAALAPGNVLRAMRGMEAAATA